MYKIQFIYFDSPTIVCNDVVEVEFLANEREIYKSDAILNLRFYNSCQTVYARSESALYIVETKGLKSVIIEKQ